ncbi:MAG TPA: AAA family ATPase [Candidatus Angelobacter sp.]|nr:AAA family ATPase [Candidatus Angelobacter sp.]
MSSSRLIIFGGLPGTGKTTLARTLASELGSVHLRIDSIEEAIRHGMPMTVSLDKAGYRVAYAVAEDNLRIGRTVIADSVNPLSITRDAWLSVAHRAQVEAVEIEVICSDPVEHRRRVESRTSDIVGLKLPTWEEVILREYHPWQREHIVVDASNRSVEQSIRILRQALLHLKK